MAGDLRAKLVQLIVQYTDLILQKRYLLRHVLELLRFLEAGATVRRINTFEIEVAASLARSLAIAFDLASFAFIAGIHLLASICALASHTCAYHAIDTYRFRLARCWPWFP